MSTIIRHASTGTHNKLLTWEIAAVFFILLFGSGLHFAFELSNFRYPVARLLMGVSLQKSARVRRAQGRCQP